ncbi:MAG: PhzF family phenazine biosynthesis protein [Salinibacter sp.]
MPLLYQVDAFTTTPFAGNPAAVCLCREPREPDWMQAVAGEMNLSETAVLRPQPDGSYRLRWFTPTHEVDLCGHATLAAAHVLWTDGIVSAKAPAHFDTASGRLTARREENRIYLDFPTDPVHPTDPPDALRKGLNGASLNAVGWSGRDYLVRLPNADAVRSLQPQMSTLATLEDTRGVIVTAPADRCRSVGAPSASASTPPPPSGSPSAARRPLSFGAASTPDPLRRNRSPMGYRPSTAQRPPFNADAYQPGRRRTPKSHFLVR